MQVEDGMLVRLGSKKIVRVRVLETSECHAAKMRRREEDSKTNFFSFLWRL